MERKELFVELISLFDEIAKLKEENMALRIKLGTGLEETESGLLKIVKDDYFDHNIKYYMNLGDSNKIWIEEEDEEGSLIVTDKIMSFEQWYKNLNKYSFLGYHDELLEGSSLNEIKNFFRRQLKDYYEERVEIAKEEKEKGGEEDGD